jgi:PIN domain nuclease of toxin-antitoxin system
MIPGTAGLLWLAAGRKELRTGLKPNQARAGIYLSQSVASTSVSKWRKENYNFRLRPKIGWRRSWNIMVWTVLPLEVDFCIAAVELPRIHDDPCDRFMIAAAN